MRWRTSRLRQLRAPLAALQLRERPVVWEPQGAAQDCRGSVGGPVCPAVVAFLPYGSEWASGRNPERLHPPHPPVGGPRAGAEAQLGSHGRQCSSFEENENHGRVASRRASSPWAKLTSAEYSSLFSFYFVSRPADRQFINQPTSLSSSLSSNHLHIARTYSPFLSHTILCMSESH